MERFRRQRSQAARFSSASKVTTITDRSSDDKLNYNDRPLRGNHHALKQNFPKPESDSSSRGRNRTTLEHQLAVELGQTSSLSPAGSLMKSLLEDEMSKEIESRRRAPSVIAKLMGLDRMPSQNGTGKQPKRPSDSIHGQTVSAGTCRHRKSCKNRSCRKIVKEQQLFKDVYEVRESFKGQTGGYSSQTPLNRKHTEDEMAFMRQKFMDAKRLSTDKKLQDSKEFHDAIDVLSSNNHLLLKLLQEPDSLFAKQKHDSHPPPQSHRGNVRNLKVSKILDYNINAIGCQAGREGSQKIDISFSRHCQEGLLGHRSHRHAQDSDKYVTFPAEGKEATSASPTKIVLLKPNLGRSQQTAKSFSSPNPCGLWPDVEMHMTKQAHDRHGVAKVWGKKRLPSDLDFSAHKSQESMELAKEITHEMKTRLGGLSFDVPVSGYKGYSADESSNDVSGNDLSNESETTCLTTYQTPYCSSFRGTSSSSRFTESSVNKEGKKRLSERWKMTHQSQEISMDKGTTLGEMLSIPDWDIESPKLDGAMAEEGSSGRLDGNVRLAGSAQPLGISSKDGWKDGSVRSLSRSRSLPNAYGHVENPESHVKHEVFSTQSFLVPKEGARHGRKKTVNRDSSLKEGSSSESRRRLSDKMPHFSRRMSKEMTNAEQEDEGGVNGNKSVLEEKVAPEHKAVTLEAPTCRLDTILNTDATTEIENENTLVSRNSGGDLLPAANTIDLQAKDDSSRSLLHGSTQSSTAQPESPASSKEADQPSPVSVLEAPCTEDPSSGSECFERVNADLHGLRMLLQLLKLESNAYDEGSSLISSDEDEASTGSVVSAKGPTLAECDSWESSYTADVLAELNLEDNDLNMLMATWNASECPVGPWIFEKLEKQYSDQEAACSRPDRRLLFESIKYGIMEITQRSINPQPWVTTHLGCGFGPQLSKARFESELRKLLADKTSIKEESDTTTMVEAALQSDSQWMDLGMHIDGIGREVGKMVLDDLIVESLAIENEH